jgi:hypothetical protein
MPELADVWNQALPRVKQGVTGVGVWTALNTCKPVTLEDGVLVLGLPYEVGELAGHLKMPQTASLIEKVVGEIMGSAVTVRVIEGTGEAEWELAKRRDQEGRRLQEQALQKERDKLQARTSWEGVYEQLGRMFAAVANKSLPQHRARYFADATKLLAQARKDNPSRDDLNERNFARCVERVAQHCEIPSGLVALRVLEAAGEA